MRGVIQDEAERFWAGRGVPDNVGLYATLKIFGF